MPTTVIEKIEGNTAKADAKGGATYARVFQVISDDYRMRAKQAVEAVVAITGIALGSIYEVLDPADGTTALEADTGAFCQEIAAALANSAPDGCQWDVTVAYGARGGEAGTFPPNPLDWPVQFKLGSIQDQRAVDKDRDGNPIVNSAGDKFDPPLMVDYSRIVFEIWRNEATFSPDVAETWKHTVNDAVFTIGGVDYAAGTVLIQDMTGEPLYSAEIEGYYWKVTYKFEVQPEGWTRKVLDQGVKEVVGGVKKAITDSQGQPVTSPEFLNGSGVKLAVGGTPVFLEFETYAASDFSLLDLSFTGTPGF